MKKNLFSALISKLVMNQKSKRFIVREKAFTLVEMMVSVSIFLIVMVIVLGALLAIIDGNKKTQAINSVSNNLSSALESMVRDIKTGYKYKCKVPNGQLPGDPDQDSNCQSNIGETSIGFTSTISGSPRWVQYWLETDPTTNRKGIRKFFCPTTVANPSVNCQNTSNYESLIITSPDIDITELQFYVKVPEPSEDQPGVFIILKATAYVNKTQSSDFSIQTFVSQRLLNI